MRRRYDGLAEWYDENARGSAEDSAARLVDLLGPGSGRCLDLGCGTGLYLDAIARTGRVPIGLDVSGDQLRLAKRRGERLVQGDAAQLPFASGSFDTVAAVWISTDVDDFPAVARESHRVLCPGGTFAFLGVHPCFNGPCVENRPDGARIVHPTYRSAGRHDTAPWWGEAGIRQRVGMRHMPLADLLQAIIDAGLLLTHITEPRTDPIPAVLALRATKPPR